VKPDFSQFSDEALARVARDGDADAVAELIIRGRPIARRIAASMCSAVLERDDAESLCIEVFMQTLPRYDATLSPLMCFWSTRARCAILDFYRSVSRVGRFNGKLAAAFIQESEDAKHHRGHDFVDVSAFAKRHGVSTKRARHVAMTSFGLVHFEALPDCGASIPDRSTSPALLIEIKSTAESALQLISDGRTREIIERAYGLNGRPQESLKAIGRHVGVTHQAIQQILGRSMKQLRTSLQRMDVCSHHVKVPF